MIFSFVSQVFFSLFHPRGFVYPAGCVQRWRAAVMADVRVSVYSGALARNYERMRRLFGNCEIAAVVKADAYGLGVENVVPVLERAGCRSFFVNRRDEGVAVRRYAAGDVYVLDALSDGETLFDYEKDALIPVFSSREVLARFPEARNIALRIDVGLNMAGIPAGDTALLETLKGRVGLLIGHLSCSEIPDCPENGRQRALFDRVASMFPFAKKSLSASYGAFLGSEYRYDMIRSGAALFGASIMPDAEPAAALSARVIRLETVPAGSFIGYGVEERLESEALVAVVPVGAGDGIVHKRGCSVVFNGVKLPVLGMPTTNYLAFDATGVGGEIRVGDTVELFGRDYPPDSLGGDAGTGAGADVLIRLNPRLPKVLL